jgi:hypothetical protein
MKSVGERSHHLSVSMFELGLLSHHALHGDAIRRPLTSEFICSIIGP